MKIVKTITNAQHMPYYKQLNIPKGLELSLCRFKLFCVSKKTKIKITKLSKKLHKKIDEEFNHVYDTDRLFREVIRNTKPRLPSIWIRYYNHGIYCTNCLDTFIKKDIFEYNIFNKVVHLCESCAQELKNITYHLSNNFEGKL